VKKINKIHYGKQNINFSDIKKVALSLKSNVLTNGIIVKKLENNLKNYFKVKNALVCSSGTAAIHLALLSINLRKNDIVLMPAINFISAYNICKIMGAKIILVDVDKFLGQITPKTIEETIKKNNLKKIKAIITMYMGGFPENYKALYNLKSKYKFFLVEDSCHALGASTKLNNKSYKVGSCKYSDISTFSMHPVKTITSGEGGIVTTNNNKLANKVKLMRSHGLYKTKAKYWKYYSRFDGLNYRLSEINCALALNQLKRLQKFVKIRRKIYLKYKQKLKNYKNYIFFPEYKSASTSSYHLCIIHLNFENLKGRKDNFIKYLNYFNIFPQYHYTPIYRLKKLKNIKISNFKGSENYFLTALSLPIFVDLNNKMHNYVVEKIINYIKKNKKKNV
tara:strand:- start:2076 stop:3254 length:1179 start_codon:yes stop_codon:yes gene_type:complete